MLVRVGMQAEHRLWAVFCCASAFDACQSVRQPCFGATISSMKKQVLIAGGGIAGMAAALGAVPAAIAGSVCTLGVVAIWMRWFKPLRDVDKLEDASRL